MSARDIFPNVLTFSGVQVTTNVTISFEIDMPTMSSAGLTKNQARVMEMLKVVWDFSEVLNNGGEHQTFSLNFRDPAAVLQTMANTSCLFYNVRQIEGAPAAGLAVYDVNEAFDFTCSGRGILVATPKLFGQIETVNMATVNTVRGKIYWRSVVVDTAELLGIIAAQSSAT